VKLPKALSRARKSVLPTIKFQKQSLSSYSGLVIFQQLFDDLGLSAGLSRCKPKHAIQGHYSYSVLWQLLIINALIGMRKLREIDLYREDPVVCNLLGTRTLPSVSTVSRMLEACDEKSVLNLQAHNRGLVLERLGREALTTVTLDFDGSVISTSRKAEGVASGFNKKKGMRSYYPLFCMVAQTGQVLDLLHRSGNVHDSNGAAAFMESCVKAVRETLPKARIEVRADSAFFSDAMVNMLEGFEVQYAISVPFERFCQLKEFIQQRRRWTGVRDAGRESAFFQMRWKPAVWKRKARFIMVRTENSRQLKGALQLDLFEPREFGYDYKCVVTNKRHSPSEVVGFLQGRGQQENVFAELKSQGALGYVPCRRRAANISYMLCALMAHNLNRELQMKTFDPIRRSNRRRSPSWIFEKIETIRRNLICRAGRLTRPAGKPILTLNGNSTVEQYVRNYLAAA